MSFPNNLFPDVDALKPYVGPPLAAGLAITPFWHGMVVKSALQLGEVPPQVVLTKNAVRRVLKLRPQAQCLTALEAFRSGFGAAPTVAGVVGAQFLVQRGVEKYLFPKPEGEVQKNSDMVKSAAIVAVASVPFLAALNGKSMKQSVSKSLRLLSPMQGTAIVVREMAFLYSLRASGPAAEYVKKQVGDNAAVEYGVAFSAGAAGSAAGHIPDSILTRLQKGRSMGGPRQLLAGVVVRAVTVGGFSACYRFATKLLGLEN